MLLTDPKAKGLIVRGEASAMLETCAARRLMSMVRLTMFADDELAAMVKSSGKRRCLLWRNESCRWIVFEISPARWKP